MGEPKINSLIIHTEDFGDCCLLQLLVPSLDTIECDEMLAALDHYTGVGRELVFVDLGSAQDVEPGTLQTFFTRLQDIRTQYGSTEISLVVSPALAGQIHASPFASMAQIFTREDQTVHLSRQRLIIDKKEADLLAEFKGDLKTAIVEALQLWSVTVESSTSQLGQPIDLNPNHILSSIHIDMEGGAYDLCLAVPEPTLCKMLTRSLRQEILKIAPEHRDGTSEILNYTSSTLRGVLTDRDVDVESTPPSLINSTDYSALQPRTPLENLKVITADGPLYLYLFAT